MASDRQIRANRLNARKSTGPRTFAGKERSSRNAHKHGLSLPLSPDALVVVTHLVDAILAGEDSASAVAVRDFSEGHLEVLRARSVRTQMLDELMAVMGRSEQIELLNAVGAVERYERLARQKRRRALRMLAVGR